jgi:endonuclease I
MKKTYSLILLLSAIFGFAQIPSGYYNTATGTGYTLKTNLKKIIDNVNDGLVLEHIATDQGYDAFDAFTAVNDLDIYYENDGTILDVYSENPIASDPYNYTPVANECGNYDSEADCYNKEHIIPQSIFSQNAPMRGDGHHLLPTDGRVNGFRSNFPFGYVGTNLVSQSGITNPTLNGSKLGNNINTGLFSGYSGTVFEPIDSFKGDIARIYFYFITRYESQVSGWTYPMFNGTSNQVLTDTFLYTMLDWHLNDPVSQKEIDRNNDLYTYQNNRNPYIDNPNYVCQIWPTQCAALSSETFLADSAVSIYPNPTNTNEVEIFTTESITKLSLVNINGQIIKDIENPIFNQNSYKLSNLPQGFYFLQISAENGSLTKKIIVN